MCGRFTLKHTPEEIAAEMAVKTLHFTPAPRYNVAPTQTIAVVTEQDGERALDGYRWGLIPSWAKDAGIGAKMINARNDQLLEKSTWKRLVNRRRLLIPADGFYEWLSRDKKKFPVHFKFRDDRVFSFAGLWDEWENPEGEKIRSCTIITTDANEVVRPVHDRMPAILPEEAREAWLDLGRSIDDLIPLLKPADGREMTATEVSTEVNNVKNDAPELLTPAAPAAENSE